MKTITYKFADGTTSAVEVSDEFYSLYEDMERRTDCPNASTLAEISRWNIR